MAIDTELGIIVWGQIKRNTGELVLYKDRITIYTCEQKFSLLPPKNLRAEKQVDIQLDEIKHITYNKGTYLITAPRIEIFLTAEAFVACVNSIKKSAGVLGGLIDEKKAKEDKERKLTYPCPNTPSQIVLAFIDKIEELKTSNVIKKSDTTPAKTVDLICKKCGFEPSKNAKYCAGCGEKI